jgi:hypothetical protein
MTKYTDKEIYTAIVEGTFEDLDVDTIVAWAQKKIASITNKAAKAKERAAAKKAEGDELGAAVVAAVGDEFESIADIAARIDGPDVTVSKVSYRLNAAAKAGILEKGTVTLEGETGKRTVVAYKKA